MSLLNTGFYIEVAIYGVLLSNGAFFNNKNKKCGKARPQITLLHIFAIPFIIFYFAPFHLATIEQ